jgi:hypothetical protein
MSNNCTYTYDGVTYTEQDFKDFLEENIHSMVFTLKDTAEIDNIIDPAFEYLLQDEASSWNTMFKKYYPKEIKDRFKFMHAVINSDRWGEWTKKGTIVWANAAKGTVYHEAWHEFSQLFLTKAQKKQLYSEAIKYIPELKNLNPNDIEDLRKVEEYLADDFMDYKLSNASKIFANRPVRNIIFRAIYKFLKALFGSVQSPQFFQVRVQEMYDNLREGNLDRYTFDFDNVYFENGLARIIPNFDSLEATKKDASGAMTAIMDYFDILAVHIAKANGVSIITVFDDKKIRDQIYKEIKRQMSEEEVLSQLSPENRELWEFIGKNFTQFQNAHIERGTWNVNNSKINLVDETPENIEDPKDNPDQALENGDQTTRAKEWDIKGNEKDSKDVASKQIKFIVRSLENTRSEGNRYGFKELVNFESTWNFLQDNLRSIVEYPEMYNKIKEISKSDPNFVGLLEQLPPPTREKLRDEEEFIALRFRSDLMREVVPIYVNQLSAQYKSGEDKVLEGTRMDRVRASNTGVATVKNVFYTEWRMSKSPFLLYDENEEPYLNVASIAAEFTQQESPRGVKKVGATLPELFNNRVDFLKEIGFTFSDTTINTPEFYKYITEEAFNNGAGDFLMQDILTVKQFANRESNKELVPRLYEPLLFLEKSRVLKHNPDYQNKDKVVTTKGNNNAIAEIINYEILYSGDSYVRSSFNASGEMQFENSTYNTLLMYANALNNTTKYPTYQDLAKDPEFPNFDIDKNPSLRGSILLGSLFNMNPLSETYGERRRDYPDGPFVSVKIVNYNGMSVSDPFSGETQGDTTVKLSNLDRMMVNMQTMLNNWTSEFMRFADKSSAYSLELSSTVVNNRKMTRKEIFGWVSELTSTTITEAVQNKENYGKNDLLLFNSIFQGYLKSELERMYKAKLLIKEGTSDIMNLKKVAEFSIFDSLLDDDTKKAIITELDKIVAVVHPVPFSVFEKRMEALIVDKTELNTELTTKNLKPEILISIATYLDKAVKDFENQLVQAGFSNEPLYKKLIKKYATNDSIFRSYILNHFVYNIDSSKLLFGDPAFYKDWNKRLPSFASTGTMPETSSWWFNVLNKDRAFRLQARTLGFEARPMDGEVHTSVLDDVIVSINEETETNFRKILNSQNIPQKEIEKLVEQFKIVTKEDGSTSGGINEADAQGVSTLDFYRIFKKSIGFWYRQHENAYKKLIKLDAKKRELEKFIESGKIDLYKYSSLKKEIEELELTVDELGLFPPIKLGYGGPIKNSHFHLPGYHKFSIVPLLPGMAPKNSNTRALSDKMLKEGLDYITFKSASKTVTLAKDGKLQSLYDNTDTRNIISEKLYKNITLFKFYKEQLQIEPKKELESTFGSQMRKLLFSNKYDSGVPIDFKGDKNLPLSLLKQWRLLTPSKRKQKSVLYKLHMGYINSLNAIKDIELENVLEEFGVEEFTGAHSSIKINNYQKLVDMVVLEARKNNSPDSIEHFLRLDKEGKLKYPLEASKDKKIIEQVLLSIVNNRLVKTKINGQPLVQVAATGHEFKFKNKEYSDTLKNYGVDKKGRITPMEVLVSFNDNYKPMLKFTHPDGEKIHTVERLNEAMNNEEWYEKHQQYFLLVGYRIPSQAMNSLAFLKIKNFLAEETMNLVVLPSAITKIAGSDFDIDKMNIIRPYINNAGEIITPLSKRRVKSKVLLELEKVKKELNSLQPPSYLKKIEDLNALLEAGKLDMDRNLFDHSILYLQQEEQRTELQIDDLLSSFEEDETLRTPEKEAELEDLQQKAAGVKLSYSTFLYLKENKEFRNENLTDIVDDNKKIIAAMPDSVEKYEKEKERLLAKYQELITEAHHQKRAHGNNIFNNAVQILQRPDSFYNMVSPNSVDILEGLADDIKTTLETSGKRVFMSSKSATHLFNPVYNNEVYNAFMGSKKGLSIAALAAPLFQLFQRSGAYLNKVYTLNEKKYDTLIYLNVNRNEDGQPSLSMQKSSDGEHLTSEIISQYISAYVDAANNPFIFYMNGSLKVAPTLIYMAFLGVPIKQAVYLANQDSIRNYVGRLNSLDSYVRKYDNKVKNVEYTKLDVLVEIWNLYKPSHYAPLMAEDISSMSQFYRKVQTQIKTIQSPMKRGKMDVFKMEDAFDANVLRENIAARSNSPNYKEINFYAFLQYVELENQSAALREVTSELKFDTNLFKSTSAANYSHKKLMRMLGDNNQLMPKEVFNDIVKNSEISPYRVHEIIKYLYKDLQKMQMHNQVQKQLTILLDEPSTSQKTEDRERLIKDYFNALNMFVIQNKMYYDEFNKPQYELQKDLGLIKKKSDSTSDMEENIATKLANLKNNFNGVNDEVDMFEQSGMLKYLAIDSSKTSDFRTLKWVGPPLKKDSINSYSSEFRYFANLQNEDYAEVKNFFRSLHKAAFLSYGENRSPKTFLPLVPTEIHAEYMIPYIEYFFEQMHDSKLSDKNSLLYKFILSFNDTFKSNHPKYFKRFTGERLGDKKFVDMRVKVATNNYVVPNPILDYEDVPVIFPLEDEEGEQGNEEKTQTPDEVTEENQEETLDEKITYVEYKLAELIQELDTYRENKDTMPNEIILKFMPKINSTDAKRETGLTVGTTKDINPSKVSKEKSAPSVGEAAGMIWEELPEEYQGRVSEDYIRNFIIEYLTDNKNKNSYEKELQEKISNMAARLSDLAEESDKEMEEAKKAKKYSFTTTIVFTKEEKDTILKNYIEKYGAGSMSEAEAISQIDEVMNKSTESRRDVMNLLRTICYLK